jgi:hypothetical protein
LDPKPSEHSRPQLIQFHKQALSLLGDEPGMRDGGSELGQEGEALRCPLVAKPGSGSHDFPLA